MVDNRRLCTDFFMLLRTQNLKGRKVFKLQLWSGRLDTKDVSGPNVIVLRCPFNLLRIFKGTVSREKFSN